MLKFFIGIVLLCFSVGEYLQFLIPLAGAIIVARELMQMKNLNAGFSLGCVCAVALAAYQIMGIILCRMPIYETGEFSSFIYTGRILLISLLLIALYCGFRRGYGRRVFGIVGLIVMNIGTAAVVLLAPILNLGYDEITIGMAGLVYTFVLGYIGSDMRMMYLSETC